MTTVSPAASLDRNEQKKKGPSCHTRDIEKTLKERKREEGEGAGLITGQPSIPITTRVCLYREHFYFIFFLSFSILERKKKKKSSSSLSVYRSSTVHVLHPPPCPLSIQFRLDTTRLSSTHFVSSRRRLPSGR